MDVPCQGAQGTACWSGQFSAARVDSVLLGSDSVLVGSKSIEKLIFLSFDIKFMGHITTGARVLS